MARFKCLIVNQNWFFKGQAGSSGAAKQTFNFHHTEGRIAFLESGEQIQGDPEAEGGPFP